MLVRELPYVGRLLAAELPQLERPSILASRGEQRNAQQLHGHLASPASTGKALEPDEEILFGAPRLFVGQSVVGDEGRMDDIKSSAKNRLDFIRPARRGLFHW